MREEAAPTIETGRLSMDERESNVFAPVFHWDYVGVPGVAVVGVHALLWQYLCFCLPHGGEEGRSILLLLCVGRKVVEGGLLNQCANFLDVTHRVCSSKHEVPLFWVDFRIFTASGGCRLFRCLPEKTIIPGRRKVGSRRGCAFSLLF